MRVTLVAAVARNRVIGRDNELPWRLPADLRHFQELTRGHTLLMGRRTWESVGAALPERRILVLTRSHPDLPAGVERVSSLKEALDKARAAGESELFVAGGAGVYREALPVADRMVLTRIDGSFAGDTFFPRFDETAWREVGRRDHAADERNPYAFSIVVLEPAAGASGEA
jgi:dihydrofolate reductase